MKLIELGNCQKPHGIKGGFLFHLYNQTESTLKKSLKITLVPLSEESSLKPEGELFKIEKISFGNKTVCYLEGVSDRNQTEAMVPFKILIERSLFPQTKEGEFYVTDLLGLEVHSQEGFKGEIFDFYDNGAQIVFVIKGSDGELIDIPFTKQFFPVVDVANQTIEIVIPEMI